MSTVLPTAPEFGAPLPLQAAPEVLRFLALRRSASALKLAAPGPSADQLADLLHISARVPDHGKLAPWRFIVAEGSAKAALADRLAEIGRTRDDPTLVPKLGKLRTPPLAVFVISAPRPSAIPEWEQILSAAAVCTNLLYGALAMGYGANWITDWYSYDPDATAAIGLRAGERVAGCIMIGTATEAPLERERPDLGALVSRWEP